MPPIGELEENKVGQKMKNYLNMLNSPIELGTRASLILTVLNNKLSLDDLVTLDYALLYSKEFGGPDNLHPAVPNHIAEIAHRREFLPESINFFVKRGLFDRVIEETGFYYVCNERTLSFVSCLQSQYYKKSWIRLDWLRVSYKSILEIPLHSIESNRL